MGITSTALDRKASGRLAQFGLTIRQFGLLNMLFLEDGLTSRQLVDWMRSDSSTVMALVDQLEKKGWVRRQPSQQDRRIKHLMLTEKAVSMQAALAGRVKALDLEMTNRLSAGEKEQMIATLKKLLDYALEP